MTTDITKKTVLITGCSSGFGLLTAVLTAKNGFNCIATMRNTDKADKLKQQLKLNNTSAVIDQLDVTDKDSICRIASKYPQVDILINNAGILITGSFLDCSEQEQRLIFETNYFGPVFLTKAFAENMINRKTGLIINVASLAGLIGHMFNASYSASKHALIGFTKSVRQELKPFNVSVVSVEPGYHKTEIIKNNATLCEHFYDRSSVMFQYNRGFLRLMFDKIIPRAADAQNVAETILKIMQSEKPKQHYIVGRDAVWANRLQKLGLGKWLEDKFCEKLQTTTKRQNRKTADRKNTKKQKTHNDQKLNDKSS